MITVVLGSKNSHDDDVARQRIGHSLPDTASPSLEVVNEACSDTDVAQSQEALADGTQHLKNSG